MPAPSSPIPFRPDETAVARLLDELDDPALSLREIAHRHNTTTEALGVWMIRPDIREKLESTDSVTTWRTRLVAKSLLHKAANVSAKIIDDWIASRADPHARDERRSGSESRGFAEATPTPSNLASPPDLRAAFLKLRAAESARRAASLLVQLARLKETRGPGRAPDRATDRATEDAALSILGAVNPTPPARTEHRGCKTPAHLNPTPHNPAKQHPAPAAPHRPGERPSRPNSNPAPRTLDLPEITPISALLAAANPAHALLASAGAPTSRPRPHEHWP